MKFGEPGWQQYFINRNNEIMKLLDQGVSIAAVARQFGITHARVQQIKRKETWKRLERDPVDLRLKQNKWYPDAQEE